MTKQITLAAVLVVAAALLAVVQWRRTDRARHVQGIAYPLRCLACSQPARMTTAELNRLVKRGEVISPPEQMRRFLCPACGQTNLVLDQGRYHEIATQRVPARVHAN